MAIKRILTIAISFLDNFTTKTLPPRFSIWVKACRYWLVGEVDYQLLPILCDERRVSIDVGAHYGVYTFFMRRYSRSILSFEPMQESNCWLRKAFPEGVEVFKCALLDYNGCVRLVTPVQSGVPMFSRSTANVGMFGSETVESIVECRTLDSFDFMNIGFVKIDVEGMEEAVLRSSTELIERCSPNFLVELEERYSPSIIENVSSFFDQRSYVGFFVFDQSILSIEEFDKEVHQRPDNARPMNSRIINFPYYVNNFIFAPSWKAESIKDHLNSRLAQ